jgi:5'-nucleotidase
VANYEQKIKSEYSKVIGKTNVLLEGGFECRLRECNLGNLVTDAMVDYYMRRPRLYDGWTDTAIAVYVGGGIRATVDEQLNNGSITLEDLLSVLPFGNEMIILEMSGI